MLNGIPSINEIENRRLRFTIEVLYLFKQFVTNATAVSNNTRQERASNGYRLLSIAANDATRLILILLAEIT